MDEASRERADRLRLLLALEIDRVVHALSTRQRFLLRIWSRDRLRQPFLATLFTRWEATLPGDLALLTPEQLVALQAFHEEVDDLRLYFGYTEDMPSTMHDLYVKRVARMAKLGASAVHTLGGLPEGRPLRWSIADMPLGGEEALGEAPEDGGPGEE